MASVATLSPVFHFPSTSLFAPPSQFDFPRYGELYQSPLSGVSGVSFTPAPSVVGTRSNRYNGGTIGRSFANPKTRFALPKGYGQAEESEEDYATDASSTVDEGYEELYSIDAKSDITYTNDDASVMSGGLGPEEPAKNTVLGNVPTSAFISFLNDPESRSNFRTAPRADGDDQVYERADYEASQVRGFGAKPIDDSGFATWEEVERFVQSLDRTFDLPTGEDDAESARGDRLSRYFASMVNELQPFEPESYQPQIDRSDYCESEAEVAMVLAQLKQAASASLDNDWRSDTDFELPMGTSFTREDCMTDAEFDALTHRLEVGTGATGDGRRLLDGAVALTPGDFLDDHSYNKLMRDLSENSELTDEDLRDQLGQAIFRRLATERAFMDELLSIEV